MQRLHIFCNWNLNTCLLIEINGILRLGCWLKLKEFLDTQSIAHLNHAKQETFSF